MEGSVTRRQFLRSAVCFGGAALAADAAAAQEGESTTIDMTDDLVFDPDSTTVAPGTTVVWENVGNVGHTVTAYGGEIPEDATYFASGGFESEDAARSGYPDRGNIPGGESYEHTFEIEGTYEYFCIPHETAGMVASLEVAEGGGGNGGNGGGSVSILPDSAKTLLVAMTATLVTVLGFAWAFLKYGGDYGDYDE